MRTTVTIDDDVLEAVRVEADASGRDIGTVLSQLARAGLKATHRMGNAGELPMFKIPAGAETIPGDRASKMIADEGL
jgi:hypothetical protein